MMRALGFDRFAVAGHDRGGRVGYRLALDYPDVVSALTVLDIVPTADVWAGADAEAAMRMYHWYFLARPRPLPETLIGGHPEFYLTHTLASWAGKGFVFDAASLADYVACFSKPAAIYASCEDYRAGWGGGSGARRGRPRQQVDQGAVARHLVGGVRPRPDPTPKNSGASGPSAWKGMR